MRPPSRRHVGPLLAVLLACLCVEARAQAQDGGSPVPVLPAEVPASAARFTFVNSGHPAGQQAVWTASDGTVHIFFQFNDRGRGPITTSVLALDATGLPTRETVRGVNYLKSPVQESFQRAGEEARWTNDSEHGTRRTDAPSFYVALNAAPAEVALLAHAARLHQNRLALLPEGEATVRLVTETDVTQGNTTRHVFLYALTGLDFSLTYVFLDKDDAFVASISGWTAVVPEGWEGSVPELTRVQQSAIEAHDASLARTLAHHPAHGVLFQHAALFDARTATVSPRQDVLVVGNRIRALGPAARQAAPAGVDTVDATGQTLLPGLWDMHAHVGDGDGLLNLAAGITTVRDLANDTEQLLARRKRIDNGEELGTRIVLAGIIDGPGPFQGPTKVLVSTEAEARSAVNDYANLGYVQIKVYSSVKPDLVPAIIEAAHARGLRVSGHIPAGMTAAQCVQLGFDEVQHVNFLVLNFMPDVRETRTPARFVEPAKRAADLDLASPEVQAFVQLLQVRHTTLDPTLAVFEDMFLARPGAVGPGYAAIAGRLPAQVRRGLLSGGLTPPEGEDATYRRSFAKMVQLVGVLDRAGIPIEAGTDGLAGFTLQRELELEVEAGIPAARALQNATLGAARIMKRDTELGSVAPGKLADLVLVQGNPAVHIGDIRNTVLTLRDGVVYRPAELYAELGVTP